jgi:predicted DNA-binding transcriptional regulator AlpA
MLSRRLRYRDLKERGIVNNRTTLKNWIRDRGFPPGQLTGPNSRTWGENEIEDYLASRPVEPKSAIPLKKGQRGRPPRKHEHETSANTTG